MKERRKRVTSGPYQQRDCDVDELREELGLRKIVKGRIPCLRCGRMFTSKDTINNRICFNCLNANDTPLDWGCEIRQRDTKKRASQ